MFGVWCNLKSIWLINCSISKLLRKSVELAGGTDGVTIWPVRLGAREH
jgi:hypothetical protein